ncbi:hypothetical protein BV22DRAFT_1029959 [Leucogyrophana mollusca]|uniref:Uncharacterized protein n=1 Tax=Leucogyrophana mollusca TaxID=85980 RepID=A0ACB8BTV1_9AGAM|nr:hypothetical protein BV22DRAFT_1029959 [Leucogyrophana mollusca]
MSTNHVQSPADLPPPRQRKGMVRVRPPLQRAPWSRFIYGLVGLLTLMTAWYAYQAVLWEREAGGWWNLALGRRPPQLKKGDERANGRTGWWGGRTEPLHNKERGGENEVERRINELADALGMPSRELASAIASAVREFVPPASLSSVAAKETGGSVNVLLGQEDEHEEGSVIGDFAEGLGKVVGLDDPPEAGV